jgi:hypothetical protein
MTPSRGDLERLRRTGLDSAFAAIEQIGVPEHLAATLDSATNHGRDPYPAPGTVAESALFSALLGALAASLADEPSSGWPSPHDEFWAAARDA